MPRYIHDDDDRTYACPECDVGGEVYRRTHKNKQFDHEFKCHKCSAVFDDPVERASKWPTMPDDGAAGVDPDGLPASLDPDAKQLIRQARGSE